MGRDWKVGISYPHARAPGMYLWFIIIGKVKVEGGTQKQTSTEQPIQRNHFYPTEPYHQDLPSEVAVCRCKSARLSESQDSNHCIKLCEDVTDQIWPLCFGNPSSCIPLFGVLSNWIPLLRDLVSELYHTAWSQSKKLYRSAYSCIEARKLCMSLPSELHHSVVSRHRHHQRRKVQVIAAQNCAQT